VHGDWSAGGATTASTGGPSTSHKGAGNIHKLRRRAGRDAAAGDAERWQAPPPGPDLQRLWQVPVEERHHRRDASRAQVPQQRAVEPHAAAADVGAAAAVGQDAGPRDGEPLGGGGGEGAGRRRGGTWLMRM
jgi:hypothetical protein